MTPEQEAEDIKLCEQEEKEAEEHDAKILAEKCPKCTEKCEWYFKNRVLPKTLSLEDSLMLNELQNNLKTRSR